MISLTPRNDVPDYGAGERNRALQDALGKILPMLDKAGLIALIEPLGFIRDGVARRLQA